MSAPAPRVLSVVWNLIRGGTEGQCARTAMAHAALGGVHRVAVFRREGFFLDPVEAACGPVHDFGIRRMVSLDTMRRIRGLAEYIRANGINLLHAWDIDAAIFASRAAGRAGIPCLTSRRDLAQHLFRPQALAAEPRRTRRRGRGGQRRRHRSRSRGGGCSASRVHLIPNILDLEEFDRLSGRPLPPGIGLPDAPLAVMVARLDPEKDVATFLRAVAAARTDCPSLQAVIAGDGVERGMLESLSDRLGLSGRVTFLGDFQAVPALLRRCTAGVLTPSANEGMSNTLLEYMAAGLPVIATDCGGNREVVEHGRTGFITAAGDAESIARHLRTLLEAPEQAARMGACGRETIAREHSPAQVVRQFDRLYREVLSHGAA
ncbi:MAG: glycosyltransferase family 4 protein [Kiritimatiellia bacterium]